MAGTLLEERKEQEAAKEQEHKHEEQAAKSASMIQEKRTTAGITGGGSMAEAIGGGAGVVLSIIALASAEGMAVYMAGIAALAIGAGLALEGLAVASRYSKLLHELKSSYHLRGELGEGITAEFAAGAGGVVLGILALLGLLPQVLLAVAVVVFGSGLLLGAAVPMKLKSLDTPSLRHHETVERLTQEATSSAGSIQVLAGLAAVILGIIALVGSAVGAAAATPMTLTLIGLLVSGASVLFSGTALSTRMLTIAER